MTSLKQLLRAFISKIPFDKSDKVPDYIRARVVDSVIREIVSFESDKPVVFTDKNVTIQSIFDRIDAANSGAPLGRPITEDQVTSVLITTEPILPVGDDNEWEESPNA